MTKTTKIILAAVVVVLLGVCIYFGCFYKSVNSAAPAEPTPVVEVTELPTSTDVPA